MPASKSSPPGRLTGVGVGPGDPELLTVRALRVLRDADRVVAPTTSDDAVGRAEAIVREAVPGIVVERLVFDMTTQRAASHEAAAARLLPALESGDHVAFVTLGDPNMYSTYSSLVAELRRRTSDLVVDSVPGIMAFQELASRSGVVVLDDSERLHLVTALDGPEEVEEALADDDAAVVIYKGGRHLPEIARMLDKRGRLDSAVFGELLGLPGERLGPVSSASDRPATYLATVIVPPARRERS